MGKDQHSGFRVGRANLTGSDDAFVAMRRGHANVHERNVRLRVLDALEQRLGRFDCGDDVDPGVLKQAGYALSQEQLVLGDYDPHGI
jgi:hypothetical protein